MSRYWADAVLKGERDKNMQASFVALLALLPDQYRHVALDIFELGHEHGYGLGIDAMREI